MGEVRKCGSFQRREAPHHHQGGAWPEPSQNFLFQYLIKCGRLDWQETAKQNTLSGHLLLITFDGLQVCLPQATSSTQREEGGAVRFLQAHKKQSPQQWFSWGAFSENVPRAAGAMGLHKEKLLPFRISFPKHCAPRNMGTGWGPQGVGPPPPYGRGGHRKHPPDRDGVRGCVGANIIVWGFIRRGSKKNSRQNENNKKQKKTGTGSTEYWEVGVPPTVVPPPKK